MSMTKNELRPEEGLPEEERGEDYAMIGRLTAGVEGGSRPALVTFLAELSVALSIRPATASAEQLSLALRFVEAARNLTEAYDLPEVVRVLNGAISAIARTMSMTDAARFAEVVEARAQELGDVVGPSLIEDLHRALDLLKRDEDRAPF